MPLPEPTARQPIHRRQVDCRGFQREDGLWDIEGHLLDTKAYPFINQDRGTVAPGEPIHRMWLRLTIDDRLAIRDAVASTDQAPYAMCPRITVNYRRLIGLTIGPGFHRQVGSRLGGTEGCTHLTELLRPLATAAFQTIFPILQRRDREVPPAGDKKPALLDTCHTYAANSPIVAREWPAHYAPDSGE